MLNEDCYPNCTCIRDLYDFAIDNRGCSRMVYSDMSDWNEYDGYVRPDSYVVSIQAPGCSEPVSLGLWVNGPVLITSKDLGFSDCLPDGVYCFSVVNCRRRYTRFYSWTCFLECRLGCLKADAKNHKEKEALAQIEMFIDASKVKAENDEPLEADKYYKMARDLLDLFECECSCC